MAKHESRLNNGEGTPPLITGFLLKNDFMDGIQEFAYYCKEIRFLSRTLFVKSVKVQLSAWAQLVQYFLFMVSLSSHIPSPSASSGRPVRAVRF
jgi:hypothetical protein